MRFIPAASLVRIQSPLPYMQRRRSRFDGVPFLVPLAGISRGCDPTAVFRCGILAVRGVWLMRMWNVDPRLMCRKHLLGEHVEMHMFAGTLAKGVSIKGYLDGGLVEVDRIRIRHDELAAEMERRGYKHSSPLRDDCPSFCAGRVNADENLAELARRCPQCAAAIRAGDSQGGRV